MITLTDTELTRFFFAIVLLLISAHLFGYIFHKYKLPKVIGEIFGGLILGPSLLGFLAPEVYNWIFNAFEAEGKLIAIIYWFGLILLMFISGFEIQKSFTRKDKKTVLTLLLGATTIPFIAGWLAPFFFDFSPYLGPAQNMTALKIIIIIAVAVTSIPVISRIFIDLKISDTPFAKIVLATATIQDVVLWILLAIATGIVTNNMVSNSSIVLNTMIVLIFFGFTLFVAPKIVRLANDLKGNFLLKSSPTGYVLFICFFFAAISSFLNINIVFGGFLAGIIVGTLPHHKFSDVKIHIKKISLGFFIPIYFAVVGLKINLIHHFDMIFFLGFLLFTTFFEFLGTIISTRLIKKNWLTSFNFAVAMNTRGGPGIILATVAYDMGIINEVFFVTLVMTAIITSLLSGYWFKFLLKKGWPLMEE